MVEADVTPPLWNSCWTTSFWKSLKLSLTSSEEGALYWKHLPKTVQTKGIFWEIQGRKKATSEEYDAFKGRVFLQKKELAWVHSAVLLLKKAQLRGEEDFFIFSLLLLGGVDGCFGQKSLKGGFVTQDD